MSDVIPKTTTWKQHKEKKAREAKSAAAAVEAGQMTLDGKKPLPNGFATHGYVDESFDGILNGAHNGHEQNGFSEPGAVSRSHVNHALNGAFVDRTASHAHPNGGDIAMTQ